MPHPVHFTGNGTHPEEGRGGGPDAANDPAGLEGGKRGGGPGSPPPGGRLNSPAAPGRARVRAVLPPLGARVCRSHSREAVPRSEPVAQESGSPSAQPGSMIVDKLLDDSRGGEGLLDTAGDGGLMTSPLNLAYFYGASPPAAAPGACDAVCSSSGPSAPGSPGSDSSDFSSASSVSSCGAVESRPRGGARAERLQGTPRPGPGQSRHPRHPRHPCLPGLLAVHALGGEGPRRPGAKHLGQTLGLVGDCLSGSVSSHWPSFIRRLLDLFCARRLI